MVRKLPLVLAIAAALVPVSVSALGLGEIHPKSALNQTFKADIDLLSVKKGEIDDVKVTLGSPEAFARAGVDRPFLLSKLHFRPERRADGSAVIRVVSNLPIREPFLDFLVEVNWPKGRLVREYTVLLDPPVTVDRTPAPVQAPGAHGTGESGRSQSFSPEGAGAAQFTTDYRAGTSSAYPAGQYGPTIENDTLWKIATTVKPDDVSVEQMIVALWRENPQAFYNNNVNNLKVGQVLRIPVEEQIRSLSRADARREFLAQTAAWREARAANRTPSSRPTEQPTEAAANEAAQAEPVEAPADLEPRLQLAAAAESDSQPATGQPEGEAAELSTLKNELLLARETGESARQEGQELRSRITELEAQLRDVQRLLKLTNDQLAQMQAGAGIEPQDAAIGVAGTMAEDVNAPGAGQTAQEPVDIGSDVPSESASAPAEEIVVAGEEVAEDHAAATAVEADQGLPVEQAAVAAVPAAAVRAAPLSDDRDVAGSRTMLDQLMDNATYLGIGGVSVVLLLGLLGLVIKRRRAEESQFQESILTAGDGVSDSQTRELYEAGTESQQSEEVSFLSDFAPSGVGILQEETGEVDPVSEADVYIAYGRYQQAGELLSQALERYPDRQDLKHKLLEIAFATKDVGAFTAMAKDLREAGFGRDDPEGWQEIVTMGRELAPDNDLFSAAAAETAAPSQPPAAVQGGEMQPTVFDLSDDVPGSEEAKPASSATPGVGTGLDFDLGLDVNVDSPEAAQAALKELEDSTTDDELTLDLDLDELEDLERALRDEQTSGDQEAVDEEFTLEDLESSVAPGDDHDDSLNLNRGAPGEDLSLDDLDLQGPEQATGHAQEALNSASPEMVESAEPGLAGFAADEVTTKLDLARAYVDMGDAEGARSILDEVLVEGDASQKQEASKLLEKLA